MDFVAVTTETNRQPSHGREFWALPLWQHAHTSSIQVIPVNHLWLPLDRNADQGDKSHCGDGTDGFAGDDGHGTVQVGLGYEVRPFREVSAKRPILSKHIMWQRRQQVEPQGCRL